MAVSQTTPQVSIRRTDTNPVPETHQAEPAGTTPFVAVLGRLTWMLFGPIVLFLITFSLVGKSHSFIGIVDGAYFGALGAVLLGRWVEFRSGAALTAAGEPATAADLRRYLRWAGSIGLAVWVAAKLGGAIWLSR
jgi:hypothetical protein